MSTFKQGDMVELLSGHYPEDSTNPLRTMGLVTGVRDGHEHCYAVKWDNGNNNSYRPHELKGYLMPDIKAKVGDHIQVINTVGAAWLSSGYMYVVEGIDHENNRIKVGGYHWSCKPGDYIIVSSQAGESAFDQKALLKQERRLKKENALQRAAKEYPAGTIFMSFSGIGYTIADKPDYEWSENTEGVYAWTKDKYNLDQRTYISKRDVWVKRVNVDLLTEAKEKFPPGTRFTNPYGSISVIDDNPEYSLASSNVYAKCITGRRVTICTAGKWADIVSRPSDRPDIGLSNYEPPPHFNVGDVVEVIQETAFFNVGHVGTIESFDGTSVLLSHDPGNSWYINKEKIKHHTVPTRKITLDLPTLSKEELTGLQEYFYPQTKTNTNGTESKQSVKLQGVNLKIREGNSVRGIGLKGSGSKIKLGSDYSHY